MVIFEGWKEGHFSPAFLIDALAERGERLSSASAQHIPLARSQLWSEHRYPASYNSAGERVGASVLIIPLFAVSDEKSFMEAMQKWPRQVHWRVLWFCVMRY